VIARPVVAVLVGVLALPGAVGAAAKPLPAPSIVKRLNAERSRLGLPARVQEVPEWSERCTAHNRWMASNSIGHEEDPGSEDYSEAGDWAGMNSVLAQGTSWRDGNPWIDAPLHLTQLLDPDLRRVGASDEYDASCVTTWPGMRAGSSRRVWTVPRDEGRIASSQRASELPFTPGEKIGLAADALTGPYLYVWSDGFRELTGGSLATSGGRDVPVEVIDDVDVDGLAGMGNGWLLPPSRLRPRTRYTATVEFDGGYTHTWSFTTLSR
jgi:hypothetical protein